MGGGVAGWGRVGKWNSSNDFVTRLSRNDASKTVHFLSPILEHHENMGQIGLDEERSYRGSEMRIDIHDVDHGGCTVITGPSGHRLMLDCGLSAGRPWYPSIAHSGDRIDTLMLLNLDEDHCADLSYVWQHCPIGAIVSNPSINAPALRALKAKCGMRDGVTAMTKILERFGSGIIGDWQHGLGGVRWNAFWNRYDADFDDTNNLSLAVFVRFGAFTILFGGDLEKAGWRKLMNIPDFRALLPCVNVYVASHHGRENGCCEELFGLLNPQLVVVSDGPKQHGTQETNNWYAQRTSGVPDLSRPIGVFGRPLRKVLTTRRDGTICIDVGVDGNYQITPSKYSVSPPSGGQNWIVGQPSGSDAAMALAGFVGR